MSGTLAPDAVSEDKFRNGVPTHLDHSVPLKSNRSSVNDRCRRTVGRTVGSTSLEIRGKNSEFIAKRARGARKGEAKPWDRITTRRQLEEPSSNRFNREFTVTSTDSSAA